MIEPTEPAPSQLVGDRYRLVGRIGRGGMGEVWLARDELLDRDVAAKRILTVGGADTEQATIRRRRAIREARAAARLSHPHAVAMFDVVVDDDDPWLVMEYFPSVSVADLLRTVGALAPVEAAQIAVRVAQALAQAHAGGLVHRDLKPGNILVSTAAAGSAAGVVKVADFGIARSDDDPTITRSGIVTGTPAYFSPEVARGAEPTSASDVYALGATLYTMIEGRPPHSDADNVIATLHRISSTEVRPMTVETDLDAVVARLLDRDVDTRPSMATARDLLADWVAASTSTADLSRLAGLSETAAESSSSPATLLPATPSSSSPGRRTRSVPAELTSFIGRVDELNQVNGLLRDHRMVVVTGPGGVGKTRLAQRIALSRDDADGPWFVEFDGVGDPSGVADALISALGITAPGGLAAVIEHLGFRTCLLVFDNCEHLVDAIADAAHQILQSCPQVTIVATSRTSLGVPGERRHALAPPADGTALFIARSPHPVAQADLADVRRLCDAVDHLPLAIELAAARTRILSVRQVLSGLSDNLDLLRRDDSGRHSRRSSLSAVISESFHALTAPRRTLLTDLSAFVGPFDVDAIASVTGRGTGLVDDLAGLVDESLVTVVGGDPRRYRLLDTVRTFAADQTDDHRRAEVTVRRREWAVVLAGKAFEGLRGPASLEWMKRIDAYMPTIRVTLEDALSTDPEAYARIVGDLYWIWYRRGRIDEGARLLDAILAGPVAGSTVDTVLVRCLVGRALLAHLAGDFDTIAACGDRLRALADGFGDEPRPGEQRRAAAEAAAMLSYLSAGAGDLTATRESAARARRFAIAEGLAWTAAEIEIALSVAALRGGDPVEARSHLDVMRRTAEEHGFGWLHASALWLLAKNILRSSGDTAEPRELLTTMITACERESDLTSWMVGMATLAYVEFVDDDHERASLLLG
ncbi:MAG: protein kinase, partial [Gordonia sp. (in: high G+C Gram-positive bacteria)]|nr:protein kinase [Gordonia sp. (in: high G+C Gram-positive bacteria)]